MGYALRPGTFSYRRHYRINSFGLRGKDVQEVKPPCTYRILCLGGSTTFCTAVGETDTYPRQLQDSFQTGDDPLRVEVLNGGVPVYTSFEVLLLLQHILRNTLIDPDMVLVYSTWNDIMPRIWANYRADYSNFRSVGPHAFTPGLMDKLFASSILYAFVANGFFPRYNVTAATCNRENWPHTQDEQARNYSESDSKGFEANLRMIARVAKVYDVRCVFVTFFVNEELLRENNKTAFYNFHPETHIQAVREHNDVIRKVASDEGCELVEFAENFEARDDYFVDCIHMNAAGNSMRAKCIYEKLKPLVSSLCEPK